jgi:hypothetical protein
VQASAEERILFASAVGLQMVGQLTLSRSKAGRSSDYRQLDRALYLTVATSVLRQGELIALRW